MSFDVYLIPSFSEFVDVNGEPTIDLSSAVLDGDPFIVDVILLSPAEPYELSVPMDLPNPLYLIVESSGATGHQWRVNGQNPPAYAQEQDVPFVSNPNNSAWLGYLPY